MIIFCVALMFTCGRCTDHPDYLTMTVDVGEDVTLTCSRSSSGSGTLYWLKLAVGNVPEVLGATYTFDNGNVNKTPRITTKQEPGTFVLHITNTEVRDSALYYCERHVELTRTILNSTFLRVKGSETNVAVIIEDISLNPVGPGDSVTLRCSVLFDSRTCSAGHSVHWFRVGPDESGPGLIHAHINSDECERSPEVRSPQTCVHDYNMTNISSSDAGTYYCAVATCGQILFGDGAKLDIDGTYTLNHSGPNAVIIFLSAALALSVIVIVLLIYIIKKNKCKLLIAPATVQTNAATAADDQQSQQESEESLVYSMPHFAKRKSGRSVRRGADAAEGAGIYAHVRVLGYE